MTAKECLFCGANQQPSRVVATGRAETRFSRWTETRAIQRYQFRCVRCGSLWWFAGRWAQEQHEAYVAAHPEIASEPPADPPTPDVIPQRSIPGTRVWQGSSGLTSTRALVQDWRKKQARDEDDVA